MTKTNALMYFSAFFVHTVLIGTLYSVLSYTVPKAHNLLQVNDYTFYSVMYMLSVTVLQGKAI